MLCHSFSSFTYLFAACIPHQMEGVDTNEAHIHHHDGPSVAMGGIDGGNNRAADINKRAVPMYPNISKYMFTIHLKNKKMVSYWGLQPGSQPFTVVCRNTCPYCKHIPCSLSLCLSIYNFSTFCTKCQVLYFAFLCSFSMKAHLFLLFMFVFAIIFKKGKEGAS